MDTAFIMELLQAVWRELIKWRGWVVGVFVSVSFAVLVVGIYWPERYDTSTMLYADVTNIIEPLLKGRAEVTTIDHSQQAQDLIYTRRILKKVAQEVGLITKSTPLEREEGIIASLRNTIKVKNAGKNYFRLTYSNRSQELSFKVLNAVVDAFITDTSEQRRQESRNAYEFINEQVESYKRQLVAAEQKLKEFNAKNTDGNEASVNQRINNLRVQIEELKLKIGEIEARDRSIKKQLKSETQYLTTKSKVDAERDRLDELKKRLDTLRLSYQETYPDIVSLKQQIKSQELVIEGMTQEGGFVERSSQGDSEENPLYDELRKRQADAELDLQSQRKRLEALKKMLAEEYGRAKRIAGHEAEVAELTRDYDVTRNIYKEMLERKEKARLSMTLDVEGQGVNYKIQEPAVYPLQPSGLRFMHFAVAAPFVGLVAAIGLMIVYVFLDPRVRSASRLVNELPSDIELLGVIPHVRTALAGRLMRTDMMILFFICMVAAAVYGALIWMHLNGRL